METPILIFKGFVEVSDPAIITARRVLEIANAIQRGDKTYLDEIPLPTPQTCGTMTQQRTYAMDKAMQIVENV